MISMRKVVTISLPEEVATRVDRLVSEGGYASTSELFRDMLREWGQHATVRPHFQARSFLNAAKRHTGAGGPKTLSRNHDRYLYGA